MIFDLAASTQARLVSSWVSSGVIGQDRHKRLTLLGLTVEARAQITNRLWRLC